MLFFSLIAVIFVLQAADRPKDDICNKCEKSKSNMTTTTILYYRTEG